tara:strand:- start:53 stop:154 length:102 start_codon:yes stop_codon:yes gene_type:complete
MSNQYQFAAVKYSKKNNSMKTKVSQIEFLNNLE